jgi:hypothetical protein
MRAVSMTIVAVLTATVLTAFSTGASAAAQTPARPSGPVALTATAGLGGVGKPGRWTPVRIAVENTGDTLSGELLVQWNGAVVHRSVVLSAPSRRQFEVDIRTPDASGTISVRLRSNGIDLQSVDIPIRLSPPDEPVTLCVTSAGSFAGDPAECTSTTTPESLPRSMRGYDAADRVIWRPGPESALADDQRVALDRWRGYRQLDDAGVLSLAPALAPALSPVGGSNARPRWLTVIAVAVSVYGLLTIAAGSLARGARPLLVFPAAVLLAALASSVALVAGHAGLGLLPASAMVVQYAATLQQLPGGGSTVSMRGVVQSPAFDLFQTRARVRDAALDVKTPSRAEPGSEEWFDADGYPAFSGVLGLGATREFTLEGAVDLSPLDVRRDGDTIRVTNASRADLRDCRFPEGFSVQRVGTLRPGQAVESREATDVDAPFFSCMLLEVPIDFVDERYAARTEGTSLVMAYLPHP